MTTKPTIRVLAIDPGSRICGYAIGTSADAIAESGVLKPVRATDDPIIRARTMADDAAQLAHDHRVHYIVVETPAPAPPRHMARNARGQATYGLAVGIILEHLRLSYPPSKGLLELVTVASDVWTRGVKKSTRAMAVAYSFPSYDAAKDPGMDAADAIGLLRWWFVAKGQLAIGGAA